METWMETFVQTIIKEENTSATRRERFAQQIVEAANEAANAAKFDMIIIAATREWAAKRAAKRAARRAKRAADNVDMAIKKRWSILTIR